jgi:predicted kinase
MLIVFAGLPGTGKSTLARRVATRLRAAYLRVDAIESAIATATLCPEVGAAGYLVAERIATGCVESGLDVVVDAVHPVHETREPWLRAKEAVLFVEVTCSDVEEHRRRVEARVPDLPGLRVPTWPEVTGRQYEPWKEQSRLVIDNLGPAEQHVEEILAVADRGEEGLRRAVQRRTDAVASGSEMQLERLLHREFVWTSHRGEVFDRESYVRANTGWSLSWRSLVLDDVRAVVTGDIGIVTATVTDTVEADGRPVRQRMRTTETWQRNGGEWVYLAGHAGPLLDESQSA